MSQPGSFVRAIVVTSGRPEYLAQTLEALAKQDRKPDAWHLVVVDGRASEGRDVGIPPGLGIPVSQIRAATFGEAVSALLAQVPGKDEWLWLIHDDSAPQRPALSRLLAVSRKHRRAGVIGAAQVGWDDPGLLLNVGVSVSRGGRRFNSVDQDDLDQGQYEGREDVLAVGLAGALVKRDVWERLGGTDPAYGVFGDSTDFCRRVWRAGHDVVVVPGARVRHAQASLVSRPDPSAPPSDLRRTHAARRVSEWYHALAWAPRSLVPLVGLWALVASLGRAVGRILGGEPRLAAADLRVPILLATRLRYLKRSRSAIARAGSVPVERPLLARVGDVVRQVRSRELGAYEAWRAENRPTDVQVKELSVLAVRRRWTFAAVAVVATALSVALYGTWLAPLFRGEMLNGQALGTTDVSAAALWTRSITGWSDAGFGRGSLDGTFSALMIPFALVPGGLAMGIGLLLTFSPLFAALAAWYASGAATRSLVARFAIALAWAAWPTLNASVANGRVGAVLAHLLLPLLALAVARTIAVNRRDRLGDGQEFPSRRMGSPTAAAASALLLAAVTVAAPILLVPLFVIILGVVIVARGHRRRVAFIPIPMLILNGYALFSTWQARGDTRWWSLLVREPGPALGSTPMSGWDLLWGVGQAPPAWPAVTETGDLVLTYLPGVTLVVLALFSLLSARSPRAVRVGWLIGALGLGTAILAQRTIALASPSDGSAVNGWPGPALSLLAVGLFSAVAFAIGAPTLASSVKKRRAAIGRGVLVIVSLSLLFAHLSATAWPGRDFGGDVHPTAKTVLPLVADLERASAPATRALVLWSREDDSIGYQVLGSDGDSSLLGHANVDLSANSPFDGSDPGDVSILAPAIAALAGAGDGGVQTLRDWGIGVVVVAPGSMALEGALMRVNGITLIGASELGVSWRVDASSASRLNTKVARVWLQDVDGAVTPLKSSPSSLRATITAGDPGRVLVIATPADPRWRATLNGVPLEATEEGVRQGFAIGSGSGHLEVRYQDDAYRVWWWAGALALFWTLIGAIPLRDRAFRKERR